MLRGVDVDLSCGRFRRLRLIPGEPDPWTNKGLSDVLGNERLEKINQIPVEHGK